MASTRLSHYSILTICKFPRGITPDKYSCHREKCIASGPGHVAAENTPKLHPLHEWRLKNFLHTTNPFATDNFDKVSNSSNTSLNAQFEFLRKERHRKKDQQRIRSLLNQIRLKASKKKQLRLR
ncbi:hypothetical protein KIN20_014114 [Parelaphostrongylus tenuis]|uniref:Uncharacterized protein n=1 Tax=Parelaphostrongylus tenuis TaxID=148309 RepID=A0AAD5MEI0_PARTN|nr:hypothetical protein KIN20_014114 [Parelaphostrongylus tenuis]